MSVRPLPLLALVTLTIPGISAQTCLSVSSVVVNPGGTASLDLSLRSFAPTLVALQWTFQYPTSGLRNFTVQNGPAAAAAGKTVRCSGSPAGYTCLLVGSDNRTVGNGVVARVTAALSPGVTTAAVAIEGALGASQDGYYLPVSSENGVVTSANVSPDGSLRPPLRKVQGRACRPLPGDGPRRPVRAGSEAAQ